MDDGRKGENITGRFEISASQMIIIKISIAIRDTIDPMDDTTFHVV